MKIFTGYENTKGIEDFALTPFLFLVFTNEKTLKVYGLGISWGWYSVYVALGFNIPKTVPFFIKHKNKTV